MEHTTLRRNGIAVALVLFFALFFSSTSKGQTYTQSSSITIPASGTIGNAGPYPSVINVPSPLDGSVTSIEVTLTGLSHTHSGDLDILLVAPNGYKVVLLSDVGSSPITNVNLTFKHNWSSMSIPITSGTYQPTNNGTGDVFPSVVGPTDNTLGEFQGMNSQSLTGAWYLYIVDDVGGDIGSLSTWSITFYRQCNLSLQNPFDISVPYGQNGNVLLSASGGTPPYSFLQSSYDSVPGIGLSSIGMFTGSATHVGSYLVEYYIQDATSCFSSSIFRQVTVTPPSSSASYSSCNSVGFKVPGTGQIGFGGLNPSEIIYSGTPGPISSISVTLNNLTHPFGDDVYAMLVAPGGQKVMLLGGIASDYENSTLTFSSAASNPLPTGSFPVPSGTYVPTVSNTSITLPSPLDSGTFYTSLLSFIGTSPLGNWKLYVYDSDWAGYGLIDGWCLNITTSSCETAGSAWGAPYFLNHLGSGFSGFTPSASATAIPTGDDVMSPPITLPFSFPYYQNNYTQLRISTNGVLSFGSNNVGFNNTALPSSNLGPAIAVAWDDWTTSNSGTIDYFTLTSPTRFVVRFQNVPHLNNSSALLNAQVILYADGKVETFLINAPIVGGGFTEGLNLDGYTAWPNTGTLKTTPVTGEGYSYTKGSSRLRVDYGSAVASQLVVYGGYTQNGSYPYISSYELPTGLTYSGGSFSGVALEMGVFPLTVNYTGDYGCPYSFTDTIEVGNPVFCNSNTPSSLINIPIVGQASPYPSEIIVSNTKGEITDLKIKINGFSHTWPEDVDILLESPGGHRIVLMSDVGGSTDAINANLQFQAFGSSMSGNVVSGTYAATDQTIGGADVWPGISGSSFVNLYFLYGTSANGTWKLYVVDDTGGDQGTIQSWCIEVKTNCPIEVAPTVITVPFGTLGNAGNYFAAGGTAPYSFYSTQEPYGVTVSPSGSIDISGQPPIGENDFPVVAMDSEGCVSPSQQVKLNVLPPLTPEPYPCNQNNFIVRPSASVSYYPSPISVTNLSGPISKVTVTVNLDVDGIFSDYMVGVLQGPGGQNVMLFGGVTIDTSYLVTLSFDDNAASFMSYNAGDGIYKPTNNNYPFLIPSVTGPIGTSLSVFNNTSPIGEWKLYVHSSGGYAEVTSWCLNIETAPCPSIALSTLPGPGDVDQSYFDAFNSTGGVPPYTYSLAAGSSLPPGITLSSSGFLSGTCAYAGTWNYTVVITDGNNCTGTGSFAHTFNGSSIAMGTCFDIGTRIPGNNSSGQAALYPMTLNVSGIPGQITSMKVKLNQLTHTFVNDMVILLLGPNNQNVMLMNNIFGSLTNQTITFSNGGTMIPVSGATWNQEYLPSSYGTATISPFGSGPFGNSLSVFNGISPNGSWSLYVMDEAIGDIGRMDGFCLEFETTCPQVNADTLIATYNSPFSQQINVIGGVPPFSFTPIGTLPPGLTLTSSGSITGVPTVAGNFPLFFNVAQSTCSGNYTVYIKVNADSLSGTSCYPIPVQIPDRGQAAIYPSMVTVSNPGTIIDVNVILNGLSHTWPADLRVYLESPSGTKVALLNNNGGHTDITGAILTFNQDLGVALPSTIVSGTYLPTSNVLALGVSNTLDAFDGEDPNGQWKLYVDDAISPDGGQLNGWCIEVRTNCPVMSDYSATVTVGDFVNVSRAAYGGQPYVLHQVSGSLPPGIAMTTDGRLYGNPSMVGTYNFQVTATSSDGCSSTGNNTIVVVNDTNDIHSGCNMTGSTIPVSGTSGPATLYPSPITISGVTGFISGLSVTLHNLNHTFAADLDILLEGPNGVRVMLLSDGGFTGDFVNTTLQFVQSGATVFPFSFPTTAIPSGTYLPTNYASGNPDVFPGVATGSGTDLNVFNGTDPNGVWKLYIVDDLGGDFGSIQGWCLNLTATPCPATPTITVSAPVSCKDTLKVTNANYVAVTNIPYAPVFPTGTSTLGPTGDDMLSSVIPIGFNFPFFGINYSSLRISTNGFVTFDISSGMTGWAGGSIPGNNSVSNLIAACWGDMHTDQVTLPGGFYIPAGSIAYYNLTSPNRFVVSFINLRNSNDYGNGFIRRADAQIIMYESGIIEIHTNFINPYPNQPISQGILGNNLLQGYAIPGGSNNASLSLRNVAYRFDPYATHSVSWSPSSGLSSATGATVLASPSFPTSYTATVTSLANCSASASSALVNPPCSTGVTLRLQAFLEGLYIGNGQMTPALKNSGLTTDQTIADSITVELRTVWNLNGTLPNHSKKVALGTDGVAIVNFPTAVPDYYLIIVKHRNTIETWSSNVVPLTPYPDYNFTDLDMKAFGGYQQDLGGGKYGFFSGDINQDGFVNLTDITLEENGLQLFQTGYMPADLNGDGVVESADFSLLENNLGALIIRP